jgi:predicted RNase H-like HicB family nuclease
MQYPTIIYPSEEGGYVAEVPILSGCLAQGETILECLEELGTVAALWLETAQIHHLPVPTVEMVTQKLRSLSAA